MKEFYVYQHKIPSTGEIFYIGKGKGNRAFSKVRNKYWHKIAGKHEYVVELVKENMTEVEAFKLEEDLIKSHNPRANICLGGGGVSGYKHGPEQLEKLSKNARGRNNAFYGKSHTRESKEKIGKANKGRITNPKKPIECITTGEVFESVTEACNKYDITTGWLCAVLKGRLRHARGLKFRYIGGISCQA